MICAAEACSLQAHKAELEAKGYAFIGPKEIKTKIHAEQILEII